MKNTKKIWKEMRGVYAIVEDEMNGMDIFDKEVKKW